MDQQHGEGEARLDDLARCQTSGKLHVGRRSATRGDSRLTRRFPRYGSLRLAAPFAQTQASLIAG
jgi:hypothetical protein